MIRGKPLPLRLSVKRNTWRLNDSAHQKEEFIKAREHVVIRDDHTCQACGFRSPPNKNGASYQHVHHLDDDHDNNAQSNLITLCPLCHQVFHIGFAGKCHGGVLIWLPEMSQVDLNNLSRSLFVSVAFKSEYETIADRLHKELQLRGDLLKDHFGLTNDPILFGNAIIESDGKINEDIMAGIRLLALPDPFESSIAHWVEYAYQGNKPNDWAYLLQNK